MNTTTHGPFKQGTAAHSEVHRDSGPARGANSPLGGGRPDPLVIHRDEDIASAPMTSTARAPAARNMTMRYPSTRVPTPGD